MPSAAIALLVLATIFAATIPASSRAAAEVPEGGFMFNKRCATCHKADALAQRLTKLPDDAARKAHLETFLVRHHARDADERALIIDYLLKYRPR